MRDERPRTQERTPQGGSISPFLCNIALHGIDDLWNQQVKVCNKQTNKSTIQRNKVMQRGITR